jgi:regulatory protein
MKDENEKLLAMAAKYCSTAERCRKEVRDKLVGWGMKEEAIETAIDALEEQQFIDEARYAGYFVRDKLKFNQWGRIKIAYALRNKQLPDTVIRESLSAIDDDEYTAILDKLVRQKAASIGNIKSAQGKGKLLRFAAQRGFTSEEIYDAIDRMKGKA